MPVSIGTRLGPYEILAPIGAGVMGEVYRATETRLHREVAVKICDAPGFAGISPDEAARHGQGFLVGINENASERLNVVVNWPSLLKTAAGAH